jgi:hypothetical protein
MRRTFVDEHCCANEDVLNKINENLNKIRGILKDISWVLTISFWLYSYQYTEHYIKAFLAKLGYTF